MNINIAKHTAELKQKRLCEAQKCNKSDFISAKISFLSYCPFCKKLQPKKLELEQQEAIKVFEFIEKLRSKK